MNQSHSLKRTSISFGIAVCLAMLALSIQDFNQQETNKLEVEANVYPERIEMYQK